MRLLAPSVALAATLVLAPRAARAFCGFYVDEAGARLENHATQVVLMRDGTRTVLSMANDYQGPAAAFAMVVPVPVVLKKEDVKTLDPAILDRIDKLDAPRLVEYWEQDPCAPPTPTQAVHGGRVSAVEAPVAPSPELGVKVEAQFAVGEYDVVVLSATDSTGLEAWLRREKYAIPDALGPYLRPYIDGGWKFFVAKVDPAKVTMVDGVAQLSPLRFAYDSDDFVLPIRLGLVNSAGTQDLIVHVLAAGRVAAANRPNVFVPTNLDVRDDVRTRFAELYAAIFDRTLVAHPKAVVTEYAWSASSCDPCPDPPLTQAELATLGADVIGAKDFTLTRLHARYPKDGVPDDLVLSAADGVTGGREVRDADGGLGQDARASNGGNAFQARYVIRHPWDRAIACAKPVRGVWGPAPRAAQQPPAPAQAAQGLARAPRGKASLEQLVAADVPALSVRAAGAAIAPRAPLPSAPPTPDPPAGTAPSGCGCRTSGADGSLVLVLVIAARLRRRNLRSEG
jgi:MYXO-CTERM domain-containing protein